MNEKLARTMLAVLIPLLTLCGAAKSSAQFEELARYVPSTANAITLLDAVRSVVVERSSTP